MTEATRDIEAMALLEQALDQPVGNRRAWIKAQDGIAPDLEARAIELLDAMPRASKQISTGAASTSDDDTLMPGRIGAYKVIEKLGQGGMGAVFKAERDAGDFDHLVAIKLVRPGILSPRLIERFERERQILAALSHPGIARLYDGGTTDEGGPYIVMEYIDGVPIDDWARSNALSLNERIELICEVCSAVGFAHQNLIIHRDLTPSNVLVTREGVPQLIDFGIAKPQDEDTGADGDGAASSTSSSLSALSLTPGYAAPERYRGSAATTLSDIYSIGKLLKVLVEDCNPDADLDAIISKAAADDPAQRYATSSELSRDLKRYIGNFPVSARPLSRMAFITKFYDRNRLPVLASAAGLAVLLGALVTAGAAYFRAEAARTAEATRVTQLRQLANYMLFDHNRELSQVVGNGEARVALVDKAQSYLLTLSELAEDDQTLQLDTALGFIELARIQGVSAQPNFGDHDLAKANLDRAEALLAEAGPLSDPSIAAAFARSQSYRALIAMHADSKIDVANTALEKGLEALGKVSIDERNAAWFEARSDIRGAQMESFDLELDSVSLGKMATTVRQEMEEWPEKLTNSPRGKLDQARLEYYDATHLSYGDATDPQRSLEGYRKAGRLFSSLLKEHPNDPQALYWRAWNAYYGHGVAAQADQIDTASELLDQARTSIAQLRMIEERDESLERFSELLSEARADLDARMGRFESALARQQSIVDIRAAVVETTPSSSRKSDLAYGYVLLGGIARMAGRRNKACESYVLAEDYMGQVDNAGDLRGYVANLRPGVVANIKRCENGDPVDAFTPTGEE